MQFTRLRLNGFKSFVDPTDLLIRPGLTGVVGPNGCGKSNLLEALRWVMGENRPTAMRGGGMEDVIFAGTSSRGGRHFAEVSLSIDNTRRLAPVGFNDTDTLEITRRITRDAGSAYRIEGKEVRARDVQMLFADAATGAHSPALVRQGQIAELINARPRARRRILEDAAGIAGLYQRRHEAELRLNATEANLARVADVVDNLSAQLATLARQARAAERYRAIGADLRRAEALLLYLRWLEADIARAEAEAVLTDATRAAARAEAEASAAARTRAEAEDRLPPLREEETVAAAIVQRLLVQRDTLAAEETRARDAVAAQEARLAQLARDIDRERALNDDARETLARLEREAAEIAQASDGHSAREAAAQDAAEQAAARLAALEAELAQATDATAHAEARHAAARDAAAALRTRHDRVQAAARTAAAETARAETAQTAALATLDTAEAALAAADAAATNADAAATRAESARAEAETSEARAREARAGADSSFAALRAEETALARSLSRDDTAAAGVLEEIDVAPGFERALDAALGDDLRAPLADDLPAAPLAEDGASGWHRLPPLEPAPPLPDGAAPLAAQVRAPDALARRLAQVGVVAPGDGAALQAGLAPGQRLVSAAGDLWRWDGLHRAAADASGSAALRLEARNRLRALQAERAVAETAAQEARAAHDTAAAALAQAKAAERSAREARRAAEQRLSEARRARSQAEAARDKAAAALESARAAQARQGTDADTIAAQRAEAEAALAALPDPAESRAARDRLRADVTAARRAAQTAQGALDELRRRAAGRARRAAEIARERERWDARLGTADDRVTDLRAQHATAQAALAEARAAPDALVTQRQALATRITTAEARLTAARDALASAETARRDAAQAERDTERAAGAAREARARADTAVDAAQTTVREAAARIAETLDITSPAALPAELEADPDALPSAATLETEIARLRRARDALGAVNLRAEADARAVQDEHDTLLRERADLDAAIAKLRGAIGALNREGRERLLAAFEQVNTTFGTLYTHLFGGGEARLVLVESDDPLEAGLEIMCQPPGKKLSTLSLLSGGEQTLTALALIFAVFLTNPAPICVLDEVDAPLDDANVARFCDLLDEMTRRTETRFLIITHNAISMARMDRLFGVTMVEQGVSQLVSVDLHAAETLVA